jgi:dihydrofolate reductase/pimeloyl-ACP methyl ester carboxylesterase
MSIDGFGAGPNQSLENPIGEGGLALHEWFLGSRTGRKMIGRDGGESGVDDDYAAKGFDNIGAWIIGRNMFGPVRGPWPDDTWRGWWGDDPPFHVPVFVLTSYRRESVPMKGGTTFHFVTDGIHSALGQAVEAAKGKDIRLGGGVATIRQFLLAGLVDEMHLAYSPKLLGTGESLLAGIDLPALRYQLKAYTATAKVLHVEIFKQKPANTINVRTLGTRESTTVQEAGREECNTHPSKPKGKLIMTGDTVSRRSLLKAGGCALAGASGLLRAVGAFASEGSSTVMPFTFRAPQSALDDLRFRLEHTRFPEHETGGAWSEGVPLAKLRALVEYWRTGYDWRRCESRLNGFPQYRTTIDGLGIHFLHVRSPHTNALPLIITHGWPGSVIDFFGIIGPLTDPTAHGGRAEDAFHVVVPSLPGFAFSDKPSQRGWNADRIAVAWAELMRRLGYSRYAAQGGDWGAWVTTRLAQLRVPGLIGIHLNMPLVIPDTIPTKGLSPEEQRAADSFRQLHTDGFGYFGEQATRPQTIGYALADSPAGQAAWIYEQFQAHTDNNGDPESALTRDQMLDDITLYWLTDSAASSARIYYENANLGPNGGIVDLPVGCSIFPREIYRAPRVWAEACYPNLIYWNELDRGGHFAAFEQPALFTGELRACFRPFQRGNSSHHGGSHYCREEIHHD